MNEINRVVVKQQARDIIKGKFFYLFLVTLVVSILTGVTYSADLHIDNKDFELFRDNQNNYSSENDKDYFDNFDYNNPIENFEFNSFNSEQNITNLSVNDLFDGTQLKLNKLSIAKSIVFAPLSVAMAGMYLALVRRNSAEQFNFGSELGGIFKNSFNNTYLKKLCTVLLRAVITVALTMLFIVPGIIFAYSSYFTNEIISDNPKINPMDAIRLSKKMVKGNRTELFILDLSFILWYLLCIVTVGIGCVYVLPYVYTTKALYYENFRMRALQEGRVTSEDFLSFEERFSGYNTGNGYNAGNSNYSTNGYSYTHPDANVNSADDAGYYYSQQNVYTQPPAANSYQQANNYATPPNDNNQNAQTTQQEQNNTDNPYKEN